MKITIYYETSDISLATAISLYYPLYLISWQSKEKANFVFERNDGLDKIVESFWRRELSVEPQTYFQQLKSIKSRLYESNPEKGGD